ncbi:hypothetical protein LDC_0608, partial [sediment metagenome]
FCDYARRRYYIRPRYLLAKTIQIIKHPAEAKRIYRSAKTFFKYLLRGSRV